MSDGHAAGALAQAVGLAVGYATTALLFIDRDTATLSVVQTDDGSVVKVLSRTEYDTWLAHGRVFALGLAHNGPHSKIVREDLDEIAAEIGG